VCAVNIDGEMVVDLWGGWADEARTARGPGTRSPVSSPLLGQEGNSPAVSSLGLGQVAEKSSPTAVKDWEVSAVLKAGVGPACIDGK